MKGISILKSLNTDHVNSLTLADFTNIISVLSNLLNKNDESLILDCLWCISNFAAVGNHEHCTIIIKEMNFQNLIQHESIYIREQLIWVIGNVAGDCDVCRSFFTNNSTIMGIIFELISFSDPEYSAYTISSINLVCVWALCNLIRGESPAALICSMPSSIKILLEKLNVGNLEMKNEVSWIFAFLSAKVDFPLIYVSNEDFRKVRTT